MADAFADNKLTLIFTLVGYQLAFIFIVFLVCIFQGHKIAGPIFKLKQFLLEVKKGGTIPEIKFRKNDHFKDLADEINDTFKSIRNKYSEDFSTISEINAYLKNLSLVLPDDKQIVLQETLKKLDEIQDRFKSP
jgi:nitrogen fixation/metabolism regulation signal transduction histidine kinase